MSKPKPQTLEDLRGLLLVSPAAVAPILSISRGKAYSAAARQELPSVRLGDGTIRIKVQELLRMCAADSETKT